MRLIAQNGYIDIDYESHTLFINKNEEESEEPLYSIIAFKKDPNIYCVMAKYKSEETAKRVLRMISDNYIRYLITDNDNYMTMTDSIDCELDKRFNRIKIEEMKGTVFHFPQEEDVK